MGYNPQLFADDELHGGFMAANPSPNSYGFRLYVGQQAICGNGVKEAGEGCDDGNLKAGDGCSATCQLEAFPSCKAILAQLPSAQDGVYPIDPDGAGPIAAANLFCDMKNGGLTLVANIYDSTGDDAPNSTDYVVSGWQQTGNGTWAKAASKVDRDVTGSGSAAVSLAFVAALKASAGQQNLKMCFVQQNGTESACRTSADNSLTLASYATGNPKLTVYGGDKLTYTFGRLAGLPGPMDCYNTNACFGSGYCIAVLAGGYFGNGCSTQLGICGFGGVGQAIEQPGFVWHGFCGGEAYAPYRTGAAGYLELANPEPSGFRLYVGL
jgi:cysteine-rich repeat protein